jgi:hypothetical protein
MIFSKELLAHFGTLSALCAVDHIVVKKFFSSLLSYMSAKNDFVSVIVF